MISLLIWIIVLVVSSVLSFARIDKRVRLVARITAVATGASTLLAVFSLVWMFWGSQPPTLSYLQKKFPARRADLEQIPHMSDQDAQFSRIAPTFVDYEGSGSNASRRYDQGDPNEPLSAARWNQYRTIYDRDGIKLGIQRDSDGNAFIMVDSEGLLNRGHVTGYLYCRDQGSSLSHDSPFEPCTLHVNAGERKFQAEPRTEAYSFREVADHWYVFDQGPS